MVLEEDTKRAMLSLSEYDPYDDSIDGTYF